MVYVGLQFCDGNWKWAKFIGAGEKDKIAALVFQVIYVLIVGLSPRTKENHSFPPNKPKFSNFPIAFQEDSKKFGRITNVT